MHDLGALSGGVDLTLPTSVVEIETIAITPKFWPELLESHSIFIFGPAPKTINLND